MDVQPLPARGPAIAWLDVQVDVRLVRKAEQRTVLLLRLLELLAERSDKLSAPLWTGFAEQLVGLFEGQAQRAQDLAQRLAADGDTADAKDQGAQRAQSPANRSGPRGGRGLRAGI